MKNVARIELHGTVGPDPLEDSGSVQIPLDHIICREADGTPHTVGEFTWPWSAYTKDHRRLLLHFYYWLQKNGGRIPVNAHVCAAREARIRELQFLMTRQIFFGSENAPKTLQEKLYVLKFVARFAEDRACRVTDVFADASLLDKCSAGMPTYYVKPWMSWIKLLAQLDPETQLGFNVAVPKGWGKLAIRARAIRRHAQQHAPLPTSIYAALINNLRAEFEDIELHAVQLLAALRDAVAEHTQHRKKQSVHSMSIGPTLIEKYGLENYLTRRGFNVKGKAVCALSGAITEIFQVCKLQIHVFSGMRHDETRTLPYHCMTTQKGLHGRTHCLISGVTTKFNKGRSQRTRWVTTDQEGFRAIRLAQRFASLIYESVDVTPSEAEGNKDKFPLFPTTDYLPWNARRYETGCRICAAGIKLSTTKDSLQLRLIPSIEEKDIVELEEIDRFRAWRTEPKFSIGQRWPLVTHQLRRSLAVYANASGLVRLSSLRRQLQHITQEMSLCYGRGSIFCINFIKNNPDAFKKHMALDWQNGEDEGMMLSFTRDVLNSKEPMFGGAGNFYDRQLKRGEIMTRATVETQMRAGLLSYTPTPLGGCTKTGGCDKLKGPSLIDISCATKGCMNLIGKHSKIIRVIQLKRAAMSYVSDDSIEAAMEKEELEALERVEREWRAPSNASTPTTGEKHV